MEEYLTPQAVVIIGLFCGVAFRYFSPYLRKTIKQNLPLTWQHRYTALILISAGVSIILYPRFQIPQGDLYGVFAGAFIYGLGFSQILAEGFEWIQRPEEKKEQPPAQ